MDRNRNFIAAFTLVILGMGCYFKSAEKERHVIPQGFIGEVIIFFDQQNGKEKEYDPLHHRIYLINNDGILPRMEQSLRHQ